MKKRPHKEVGRSFREPGLWESLRELLLGARRSLDCIQVEVTTRCPGRCSYCPHTTMREQWHSRDMSMETFSLIWPLMRRSGRVHLQGWGEPLLNPAFFEMAALARKAGCSVSTTTCGLLMNEDVAEKLVESGLDIVAFSLAGTDQESNISRRGVEFDRVKEAITILQTVRKARMGVHLEIHLAYLMLASNMEAVRHLPELMEELGVHAAVISTLDFIPVHWLEPEGFKAQEMEKVAAASEILKEAEGRARALGMDFHWSLPRPDAAGLACRENVARSVFIAADGSVSPCVYLNIPAGECDPHRLVIGNLHTEDAQEIWESDFFRSFREGLAQGDPDPRCVNCVKRFEC